MKLFSRPISSHFKTARIALLFASVTLSFQNCSVGAFRAADTSLSTVAGQALGPAAPACVFDGQTLAAGDQVQAFLSASSASSATTACVAETRVCQANGLLQGSYPYSSCSNGPADCLFNGRTIASGQSVTAYSSGAADTCAPQGRACADGVLSGSYAFGACGGPGATACLFAGRTIADHQSVQAFAMSNVPAGQTCAPQVRACLNGVLTGAGDYDSCVVGAAAASCSFNGQTLASGQSTKAYTTSNVPAGQSCQSEVRNCTNGALSGSAPFATCQVDGGGAACLVNGQTIADGASISLYRAPVADVGQTCATESRQCVNGTLSGSATYANCFARQKFISADYVPPSSKEGVTDILYDAPSSIQDARYARFRQMGLGYKEYNLFWSRIESGTVPSSAAPVACPAGTFMAPASEAERVTWGFHKFRCLTTAEVTLFDQLLMRDAASGLQSGAVLWSTPPAYRYPGCQGLNFGATSIADGCVPRDDAMDDYEDYVNFLANRYSGRAGYGKLSHLIVWNENASAVWFNYSPVVPMRGVLSAADQNKWIAKYAQMVARTHDAAQRNTTGVMIDVSTDLFWLPPRITATQPSHIGNKNLIDGLWQNLGARYSWSVAVHPYGNLDVVPAAGRYSFLNIETVAQYQAGQLQAQGLPTTSFKYPQAYLIASEQGWPQSIGIAKQAKFICQAQALSLQVPTLLTQAHNYFHSNEPQEATAGSSNQGAFYGLIPFAAPTDLSTLEQYPTGLAYLATSPAVWGQNSTNYCCQQAGVGCRTVPGAQAVYRFVTGTRHFFSLNLREGLMAGMTAESTGFTTFTAGGDGRSALYRCRTTTNSYFSSSDAGCEGQVVEGSFGFVQTAPQAGLVPLYRLLNPTTGDHLTTLNSTEGAPGYRIESTLGFVPAP